MNDKLRFNEVKLVVKMQRVSVYCRATNAHLYDTLSSRLREHLKKINRKILNGNGRIHLGHNRAPALMFTVTKVVF